MATNAGEPAKPKEIFNGLSVYRDRGAYLRRLEQFGKAKAAYDEAHRLTPEDIETLTGRSQTCADAAQSLQAYRDADLACNLAPESMDALNVKAHALYALSEFEQSIVMNYRGLRNRRQPPYFLEGKNQGVQTIHDCIGENARKVMLDFLPLLKKIEAQKVEDNEDFKPLHKCRIPKPKEKSEITQAEMKRLSNLARILAMTYLGPMALDKFFFERLAKDHRIKSANAKGADEIKNIVKTALDSLTERQEILRSQRPYYNIKSGDKTYRSKHLQKFRRDIHEKDRKLTILTVENSLKDIERCLAQKKVKELISKSERLQSYLDSKTVGVLPEKDMYLDKLYRAVGEAYLSQYKLSYTHSERGTRRRIAFLMGLPVSRQNSYDSVMANYPHKYVNIKLATQKVKTTLDNCDNATMKCWLLYELAKLLCLQKNYSLSKYYSKQCQREAQDSNNVVWWLNAYFILMSSDMQHGNANEVRLQVEEALVWAKKLCHPERVQAFLSKCGEMAAEIIACNELKKVRDRERRILTVMSDELKVQTEMLLDKIAIMPPRRRMSTSFLPVCLDKDDGITDRYKRKQKDLTVIPGKVRALPIVSKTRMDGYLQISF